VDRNLALEMVRVTEAAAVAAARWMVKGDADAADQADADAMHQALYSFTLSATTALGKGDRETIPQLCADETFGFERESRTALAPSGPFFNPPSRHLEKQAVGPRSARAVDLNESVQKDLGHIAEVPHDSESDLTVVAFDRASHTEPIERIIRTGARVDLIRKGDVAVAMATAVPESGIDVLMGTGGATAGVLAAAALGCIGGERQTRLAPADRNEMHYLAEPGYRDTKRVHRSPDLVAGDTGLFAATGITDGDILNGVCIREDSVTTNSPVVRSQTRSRRFIVTEHYSGDISQY
jgi:fructose-1,6-bisphosphatase II